MPRALYSVSQNPFIPYEPVPVDSSNLTLALRTLYGDEPCYLYDVNSKYKAQLSALIDGLANVVLSDEFNPNIEHISQEVRLLKTKLEDTSYVSDNPQVQEAYYRTYKKNLETIFFLIKDWDETKKRQFIMKLGERVMVCATGAHTQLAEILFELTEKPSLISWLAGLRKNIVHQFAENWIVKHRVEDGSSIHVHYFCHTYSETSGWNIPGFKMIAGYSDERFKPRSLNSTTQQELKRHFETQYNYQAMNDNVVVNFNLLLSPYYNIPLTPDHNTNICSIIEPFTRHGIFDMSAVYTYGDGEEDGWRIKPDFQANLPKYIKALLLKEKIITSNVPEIVNEEMIPLLEMEIERLKLKYGETDNRIQILENTTDFLLQTITKDETTDHLSEISTHINEIYLNNSLDKYSSFEKIGICLLNMLMILPLGIPGAIKYATTGSFFFSLRGKSQELLNTIHQEVSLCC
ncbi:MAG: hypothetical protein NTZ86_09115 [Legionellales bacterium]|nr:hypothetical protein [Legionellales bacterium]